MSGPACFVTSAKVILPRLRKTEFGSAYVRSENSAMLSRTLPRATKRSFRPSLSKSAADRKSTRLNSSHPSISYAVFCLKKKKRRLDIVTHEPSGLIKETVEMGASDLRLRSYED